MEMPNAVAIASVVAAVVAVAVAVWQVRRSSLLAHHANEIAVVTGLINEFRSPTFQQHLHAIETMQETPARDGFDGLDPGTAASARALCYFFEYLGYLVAAGHITPDLVLDLMSTQIMTVWSTLQPHIDDERRRRDRTYPRHVPRRFLPHYEQLVQRARHRQQATTT
jgi:hypothetical protein